jgi:hypothetical protein
MAEREEDKTAWLELAAKWKRLAGEAATNARQAQEPQADEPGVPEIV